ncbi:hypothetical protein [Moritella sp. F3]|uniref:hypothetical protein n=1 Tax=Moritella sp. F3 TaxID=2718882 RepID=UPI0018E18691|nr:hypothetical protein [Moritella sp. F3]GIC77714.1 hypothetical protein FMO001_24410 [Moritella sp. F1]GIC82127.1 hypothetical protein FMO003_24080 [Moritella sp. F3]
METSTTNYQSLVNSTYTSPRDCIEGHFYFDATKRAWFKILKATFTFVSFEYSFGDRWTRNHHKIIEVKRCSKKQAQHIMECSKEAFSKLKA